MPDSFLNVTTYAGATTDAATLKKTVWREQFKDFASQLDQLAEFEGPDGSDSFIQTQNDLKNTTGEAVQFHTSSDLGEPGQLGESPVRGNEEKLRFAGYKCIIDFRRHGTGINKKMKRLLAGGASMSDLAANRLGKHFGWRRQRESLLRMRNGANLYGAGVGDGTNHMIAGERATLDDLGTADVFSTDLIVDAGIKGSTLGIEPASTLRGGASSIEDVYKNCILGEHMVLKPLFKETAFLSAVQYGDKRGKGNAIFNGAFPEYDGAMIKPFRSVHSDIDGPIGSAMAPVARLGVAVADGDGQAVDLEVSATNTKSLYFADFPGYDFLYYEDQAAAPDASTYRVLIVNPDGTFGYATYVGTANNGNKITTTARITIAVQSVDDVNNAAGPWTGKMVDGGYDVGAMIYLCNDKGVPICHTNYFGRGGLLRAYGADMEYNTDHEDYKFATGMEYCAVYGDVTPLDRLARTRNSLVISSAYNPVGSALPTIAGT